MKFGLDPKLFALHLPNLFQSKVPHRIIDRQGRWKCRKTKYRYCKDRVKYVVEKLKAKRGY